jgi:hypothetical protein
MNFDIVISPVFSGPFGGCPAPTLHRLAVAPLARAQAANQAITTAPPPRSAANADHAITADNISLTNT